MRGVIKAMLHGTSSVHWLEAAGSWQQLPDALLNKVSSYLTASPDDVRDDEYTKIWSERSRWQISLAGTCRHYREQQLIEFPVAQTLIRAYNSNIDISLHHKKLTEFLTEDLANAGLVIKKASMKATNVKKVIHEDIAIAVAQTLNMTYNLNIDISKGASYPRVTSFLVHQLGLSLIHI